jgi:hypothetical protein
MDRGVRGLGELLEIQGRPHRLQTLSITPWRISEFAPFSVYAQNYRHEGSIERNSFLYGLSRWTAWGSNNIRYPTARIAASRQ